MAAGTGTAADTSSLRRALSRARRYARHHRPILVILAVALALRVAWLLYATPVPVSDFNDYRTLAEGIIDHRQFGYPEPTAFFLPVHPTFLALLMLVSRSDLWLGFGMVAVSTASCLLVYLVARRLQIGEGAALIAAGIFAVLPTFVLYAPVLATEHLFIALILLAMLSVFTLGTSTGWRGLALGALLGLAILTRGEGMFYTPAFLAYLWFGIEAPRAVRMRNTLLIVAGIVAVLAPWYLRNTLVVSPDAGLSSSAGMNFYFAHNDSGHYGPYEGNPLQGLPAHEASREGWRLAFEYLRENPLRLVKDIRRGTQELFRDPEYALHLSTQDVRFRGDPDHFDKELALRNVLGQALRVMATLHLAAGALSVLLLRRLRRHPLVMLILPLIASSWALRTVLYWAAPRFGYLITVMLVFFSALTIATLVHAGRRGPGASGDPVPVPVP